MVTREALLQLYIEERKSLSEIGKIFGKNPKTISNYLKKFGIKARPFSTKGLKTTLGRHHSEETKKILREQKFGKKLSKEHRNKVIKTLHNGKREDNPNWKGGKYLDDWGYIKVKVDKGYKSEHRLVVEKNIGRKLTKQEAIHHINGIKEDNRIENLRIMNPSEHQKLHRKLQKE